MVRISAQAVRQLRALQTHYEKKERPEAAVNLSRSVDLAIRRIEVDPEQGLRAPRPYPALAADGRRWIKEGRYWFRYSVADTPVILAVFYETADLPGRS